MSVENPKVIDLMARDEGASRVFLVISDHLEWDREGYHLQTLQTKINSYIAFIESGELVSEHPKYADLQPVIQVKLKHRPDQTAERFFAQASDICLSAGIELEYGPVKDYHDRDS